MLVVLNPTAHKRTIRALDIRASVDRDTLLEYQHHDGSKKLLALLELWR